MKKSFFYFLICLSFYSCKNEKTKFTFDFPTIEDTTKVASFYFSPENMQRSKNEVSSLQKIGEPVIVNSDYKKFNYYSDSDELEEYKNLENYPKSGFSIYIDTKRELSIEVGYTIPILLFFPDENADPHKRMEDSIRSSIEAENWEKNKKMVKAMPVYIVNHTSKSIVISENETELILIQEALDKDGNWKPIEYYSSSSCGHGSGEYILRPNYYLMTKIYKYKGEYETLLRIKMASDTTITYSKPFKGSVNLSQFKPFKESYVNFLD